jgi:hypothetical protein
VSTPLPSDEQPPAQAIWSARAEVGANEAPTSARPAGYDGRGLPRSDGATRRGRPIRPATTLHWLRSHRQHAVLLAFVLPALVYIIIFFAYPLVYGFKMSVEKLGFIAGSGPFVGLHNYKVEINDPVTRTALMNTAIFLVVSIIFQFSIGLAVASYFNRRFFLARFLRSLIIVPWLFPPIASATIFSIMFAGQGGIIDEMLRSLHLISSPSTPCCCTRGFRTSPKTSSKRQPSTVPAPGIVSATSRCHCCAR